VCRQVTAICFRWCDRGQHGTERRVKNAVRGRSGDLGGPEGGRDRRDGSFLMRRAGLVACANRQNRAAGARHWQTQGNERARPPHKRERHKAVRWSCAARIVSPAAPGTPDGHEQQGTSAGPPERGKGWNGLEQRAGAADGAGGKKRQKGRCNDREGPNGIPRAAMERSAHPADTRWRLECIARIAARLRRVIADIEGVTSVGMEPGPKCSAASQQVCGRSSTWETRAGSSLPTASAPSNISIRAVVSRFHWFGGRRGLVRQLL